MKRITYCKQCNGIGYITINEDYRSWSKPCPNCQGKGIEEVPITNYERVLQQMTPEDLATMFHTICDTRDRCAMCPVKKFSLWSCNCGVGFKEALNQEATK